MYELTRKELIMTQERKPSFICAICGGQFNFLSTIIMQANYGSAYDGDRIEIPLCGDCFDVQMERAKKFFPSWIEIDEHF